MAESTLNENPDAAVAILQRMVDLNVRVAVDDFGSRLAPAEPPGAVAHRRREDGPQADPGRYCGRPAVGGGESLIQLGRTLGVQVVAQGIETPEQLDALCRMGCELGQGLCCRPLERSAHWRQSYWSCCRASRCGVHASQFGAVSGAKGRSTPSDNLYAGAIRCSMSA